MHEGAHNTSLRDLLRQPRKQAAEKGRTLTSLIEEARKAILSEPQPALSVRLQLPISRGFWWNFARS